MRHQIHLGDHRVATSSAAGPWRRVLIAAAAAALLWSAASAAEPIGTLRVTQGKAEVIRLDEAASVVMIANPQLADVVVERNQLLFVLGRRPGETRLYVYGSSGQKLLERDLVVVPSEQRTITVIRDTQATGYSCDPRCVAVGSGEPAPAIPAPAPATAAR